MSGLPDTSGLPDLAGRPPEAQAQTVEQRLVAARLDLLRRPAWLMYLAGASVIAIPALLIALVLGVFASGSASSQPANGAQPAAQSQSPQQTAAQAPRAAVAKLLGGIEQSGAYLGSPTAPVTIQYFGDLECPACQEFTLDTLPSLIADQVRGGKVRIEYRSLETATRDPTVFRDQQVAALAAGGQNRMWEYIELFYLEQGQEGTAYVTESYLDGLAEQVPGLALTRWEAARADPALGERVARDAQAAGRLGFNATPSLLVSGPRGTQHIVGVVSYSQLASVIRSVEIACSPGQCAAS